MFLDKSGMSKALGAAYKSGGYTLGGTADILRVYSADWYLEAPWKQIPRKALAKITEHIGIIDVEDFPLLVHDGTDPQSVMPGMVGDAVAAWHPKGEGQLASSTQMFIGPDQLWQTAAKQVYKISLADLEIMIDGAQSVSATIYATDDDANGVAMWQVDNLLVALRTHRPPGWESSTEKAVWNALESVNLVDDM